MLAAAGALAATAAAAGPALKRTTAGDTAAQASLLPGSVLPGFKATTKRGTQGFEVDCSGWRPSGAGIVETGSANSPDYSGGTDGPFIIQLSDVFATAGQASALWTRAVKPGLIACVTSTLDTITTKGIRVKVLSQGALAVSAAGPMTAAYRVIANLTSSSSGSTLKTYFDVVLVGRGKTLSELTFSSFGAAVPTTVESALAAAAYRLIGLPVA